MKTTAFGAIAALVLALCPQWAFAQAAITYLLSDNLCINKHDYQVVRGYGTDFYEFYAHLSNRKGARLVFRVPKMDGNLYVSQLNNLLPNSPVLTCGDFEAALTPEFVDAINSSMRTLYILEKTNSGYISYQVHEINQIQETPTSLAYGDRRIEFFYRYDSIYAEGEKANFSTRAGKVVYQKITQEQCKFVREFRTFSTVTGSLPTNISFLEGVGIVRLRDDQSDIELITVNGKPVSQHVALLCTKPTPTPPTPTPPTPPVVVDNSPLGASKSIFTMGEGVEVNANKVVQNTPLPVEYPQRGNDRTTPRNGGSNNSGGNKGTLPTPPKEVPPGYHVVVAGESLYSISQQYGTTVDRLRYWNKLSSDKLQQNQLLKVIDDGTDPIADPNPLVREDAENRLRLTIHVVQHNDNLGSIAKRYQTTIKDIYALNQLESDLLNIGQEIIVHSEYLP